jgi:cytochrome b6-f complex iron-sulfur subunit
MIHRDTFMEINRRQFLVLSAATACAATACGCAAGGGGGGTGSGSPAAVPITPVDIDAGPAAGFAADAVYDQFVAQGFFVIRKGERLFALSAFCTHRHYRLEVEADQSFYCKSHGSCFASDGKVTEGPAIKPLPELPTRIDARGHLIVLGIVSG